MKRSKLLLVLVLAIVAVMALVACDKAPVHEHTYGAWEITTEPDLTTAGKAKRTCECGYIDNVDVPALENASVWTASTVVRASHDEEGLVRYTSVYGTVETTVAKGEHSWSSWKIVDEPTMTLTGTAARFCTTDNCKSTKTVTLPVLSDSVWTAKVTAATCTTPEIKVYSSVYGDVTVETAPANGHNFTVSAIVTEPTCTEGGVAKIKCSVCNHEETKEVAALGHDFGGDYVPYVENISYGDDEESGTDYDGSEYHAQKCSRCGKFDAAHKQAHDFEGAEVIFTSHENGGYHQVSATRACKVCGYNANFDQNWGNVESWTKGKTVEATYTSAGYTEYTTVKGGVTYTYKLPIAKLVAPYEGKTYTVAEADFDTEVADKVLARVYKIPAFITIDDKGTGHGEVAPFRGDCAITMVDATTGKISILADGSTYNGYVDAETGLIVYFGTLNRMYILTPFDSANSEYKASQFASSMAIEYTPDCNLGSKHSFTMFVNDDKVYFGVRFNNGTTDINANECYEAENLVVFDKDGNKIKGFKKVDGTTTALDGYEGTYTNGAEKVVVDGVGKLTITNADGTLNGIYTKADDHFEVYVVDANGKKVAYYHVTLSGDTYTKVAQNATVKFTSTVGTAPSEETVFANVDYTLPTMDDTETKKFMGWKLSGSDDTITSIKPAIGEEINLEAVWADKVMFNIVDSVGGNKTVYVGVGDTLSSVLPAYETEKTMSSDNKKYFVCWYIDANNNGKMDEDETVVEVESVLSSEDNGMTIVANWADACILAGTYYGQEVYNAGYGSSKANIVISVAGMISGKKTGKIIAYDAATGKVTWKEKKSDGTYKTEEYCFWYDATTEVIAGIYNDKNIGNDFYIMSTANTETNYTVNQKVGIRNYADGDNWSIQFVNINTVVGARNILLYNNHIYSNIVISDAQDNTLTVLAIQDAKTLIVKDAITNNVIVSVAAINAKFGTGSNSSKTKALDEYFGTYTCEGKDNIVFDGVGGFTWGSKNGTYTLKDAEAKTFDAYVVVDGKNTEYYVITLDTSAKTYVAEEQKVTINFTSTIIPNEDISAVTVWKNVEFTLQILTSTDNMFRGWYIAGAESKLYNGAYTATADVTLIAKWDAKFTFTAVFNDGTTENLVKEYGEGDKVNVDNPVWKKHKFDGWFTTATFDEGTEWKTGTAITANVTVYAKWSDAEAYYNNYTDANLYGNDTNGNKSTYYSRSMLLAIDADGNYSGSSYPFSGTGKITNYNKETGEFMIGGKKAILDASTGIIIVADGDEFGKVFFMTPFESKTTSNAFSSSYWNSGNTRVIEYTFDDTTYRVFVHNGKVYFNVQFKSALTEGTDVKGENAYQAELLCVLDSEGNLLFKFAYDGTTMVELDGNEGTYTEATVGSVELNGVKTIKFGGNTGVYSKTADANVLDVYMTEGDIIVYYSLTIDKTNGTCTIVKPMVTITYDADGVTPNETLVASESKNMNVAYALPTLTNATMILRGWYVLNDETKTLVPANYVPTADVTLVAKWDQKVTLTIVYGNGIDNKTVEFGAGDALSMSKYVPEYTNGKVFDHWYISEDNGVTEKAKFTGTKILEDTTVYCAWIEAVKWYGEYIGGNVYGNSDTDRSGSSLKIDATGKVTGTISGKINSAGTEIDDGSSRFMASDGNVIITRYRYGSELGDDFYFFVKADAGTKIHQYKHLGVANQVVVSYVKDGVTIYALVYGNEVFDNVSWTSSDGNTYAAKDLYNTKGVTLTFTNANGDVVKSVTRA